MYLSMIDYPKRDWHPALGHKRLCYNRATAGTFILSLLYIPSKKQNFREFAFRFNMESYALSLLQGGEK